MAKAKTGFVRDDNKARKKTRQGYGRGTKFSTRVSSKRFKKKKRGQG
jgi:stress-induced morphogen